MKSGIKVSPKKINKKKDKLKNASVEVQPEAPQINRSYEIVDEYDIIPRVVSIEIAWNKDTMETLYIVHEPEISEAELQEVKIISKNMEQIVRSSNNLPTEFSVKDIEQIIDSYMTSRRTKIPKTSVEKYKYYIQRDYEGFGPLDPIIRDQFVEDISCNGIGIPIFIEHKRHGPLRTNILFASEKDLDSYVIRLAQLCGKEISMNDPIMDGTFPQGHRIQITYGNEISTKGSSFTFRLFRETPFTPVEIVKYGAATADIVTYLWFAVENLKSGIIAGVPGVGKTSTLNAMMMFIPPNTKVFSIEETREINIMHENWVATSTRESVYNQGNLSGHNAPIGMFELVRMAMRQRPTYILLGEIRGRESYSLFQAISTGHTAYSTIHADSMDTLVNRLESTPLNIPRVLISSLNFVIFNKFVKIGNRMVRKITEIDEVIGVDAETREILYNKVYSFDFNLNTQIYSGYSKILKEIQQSRRMTDEEFNEEFERRKKLVGLMVDANIVDYANLTRIVNIYYKDPAFALRMAGSG